MNEFRVVANEPLDFKGTHYESGDVITMHCDECAPLLVMGRVRLENMPAPKKRRGRPARRRSHEEKTEATTVLR